MYKRLPRKLVKILIVLREGIQKNHSSLDTTHELIRELLFLDAIDSLACFAGLLNEIKYQQNVFTPSLLAGFYNALFSTLMEPPFCGCRHFILSYLQQVFFQKHTLLRYHWKIDKQDIDVFLSGFDIKEDGIPDIEFYFYKHVLINSVVKAMKENNYLLIGDIPSNPSRKIHRLTNELRWLSERIIFQIDGCK